ncbi:MAG: hypothetical protein NW214_03720 [Pseudanabaenaceae cyanobacterium bins.39]|nr:hypothetical protein [Pseudanabaenaceae cyanobacterium bins.39]
MKLYRQCQNRFLGLCPTKLQFHQSSSQVKLQNPWQRSGYNFAGVTLIAGILLSSCGESRVLQCNKIANIANKAVALAAPIDDAGLIPLAESIDQIKVEVQAIAIQDNRLKDLQTQLVGMYGDVSTSLRAKAQAITAKDANAINKLTQDLAAATAKESGIVDEINAFCSK